MIARFLTITVITCMLTLTGSSAQAEDQLLKRKLDSLFVIASSGEVQHRDQNEPAMDSIATHGTAAVPFLIDKFTTKSARERWTVIWTLQRIGAKAVPQLVAALRHLDGLVVERVCTALGEIKDSSAVTPLMEISRHPRWQVRDQAITALGKIGHSAGGEAVMVALSDSVGEVRKSAVVAAGSLRYAPAVVTLISMFNDQFYGARLGAIESLAKMDSALVRSKLRETIATDTTLVGDLACDLFARLATLNDISFLLAQLEADRPERRARAAMGIVSADPTDNCGYHKTILGSDFLDPLTRLKIESIIVTAN